jgi:hypothetical protein
MGHDLIFVSIKPAAAHGAVRLEVCAVDHQALGRSTLGG